MRAAACGNTGDAPRVLLTMPFRWWNDRRGSVVRLFSIALSIVAWPGARADMRAPPGSAPGGASSAPAVARASARGFLARDDEWFRSAEAARITGNILSFQSAEGGWPKNTDTVSAAYGGPRSQLRPTFDNGATLDELRFLARRFQAAGDDRCREAFLRGVDHVLQAQYATGGWPQFHPPGGDYHRHITFNDDAMVRILRFVRDDVASGRHGIVDAERARRAREAFARGIECILDCQIMVDGRLTAWCAQHDENDFSPRPARTFEPASLSGAESVGIVRLLMSLDEPGPRVVQAVEGAIAWFESARLTGIKVVVEDDPRAPKGRNKVVVADEAAPAMWARFYDIATNRPIFCDRDGIPRASLADIGSERRNGYAWLGYWPRDLVTKEYPAWRAARGAPQPP